MGRRDRERRQRVAAGLEAPIRHGRLTGSRLTRSAVRTLQAESTDRQVQFLNSAVGGGRLSQGGLHDQLASRAQVEMRKGVERLVKEGKTPTVELLLEDYRREKSFQKLAASVGLDERWFINLAESEIKKYEDERCQETEGNQQRESAVGNPSVTADRKLSTIQKIKSLLTPH